MEKIGKLLKEPKMCCIGLHTTSGVVGVLLLLVGGCQIGIGIYFQLTPPGFHIASNIWTGLATGVAGTSLMYYGHANHPLRNNYIFLILCLISLLTNILNVVIVQVGENSKFLTEEDREFIYQDNQKKFFDIAIFSSTIISSVVIIFTFAVAQCLFCGHLKRPKLQNQIAFVENLNQEKLPDASGNRFFPPSRTAAKELIQPLPPLEDVLKLSDPKNDLTNSDWVYNTEDKISKGLYPLGLENSPKYVESTPCMATRNSSFTTPRYARVHHRPQRAQSFASSRDPFRLNGDRNKARPLPVSIPQLHYASVNGNRIRKSNSFTYNLNDNAVALSRKYHAFTLNRDVNYSVIEVGSLKSINSEKSLRYHVADISSDLQTHSLSDIKKFSSIDTNEIQETEKYVNTEDKLSEYSIPRVQKIKGPAPLPPAINTSIFKRCANNKDNILSSIEEIQYEQQLDIQENNSEIPKKILQQVNEKCFDKTENNQKVKPDSDNFEEDRDLEEHENPSSYDSHLNRSILSYEEDINISLKEVSKNVNDPTQMQEISEHHNVQNLIERDKCINKTTNEKKENNITTIQKVQDHTLNQVTSRNELNIENKNSLNKNSPSIESLQKCETESTVSSQENSSNGSQKSSIYATVHQEIVAEARFLLDKLPNTELQKHKIVLRVPSFKTTGCQTECYRPLRRRASCSQGNIFLNPRHLQSKEARTISYQKDQGVQNISQVLSVGSSSSSGYSSPDGGSKYASPIQSGPPSPCSSYETVSEEKSKDQDEPNVTVIEINKHDENPPTVILPSELCNFSSLICEVNKFSTNKENSLPIQSSQEHFSTDVLHQNMEQLTEAINPMISAITNENDRIPRIINAIYKNAQNSNHLTDNRILAQKDDDYHSSTSREYISLNHPLYFPREISYTRSSPSLLESPQAHSIGNSNSTAAFLTSLELLASHYRQRALANAKQLQIQQTILEHENLQQSLMACPESTENECTIPNNE